MLMNDFECFRKKSKEKKKRTNEHRLQNDLRMAWMGMVVSSWKSLMWKMNQKPNGPKCRQKQSKLFDSTRSTRKSCEPVRVVPYNYKGLCRRLRRLGCLRRPHRRRPRHHSRISYESQSAGLDYYGINDGSVFRLCIQFFLSDLRNKN